MTDKEWRYISGYVSGTFISWMSLQQGWGWSLLAAVGAGIALVIIAIIWNRWLAR